ncbi:MAG: pyridoxamine 5'-phosphate oxidase family protein [Bdellovibrionales bacterium]
MKPHHGEIKSLNSSESIKLLEQNRFGHLACHTKDDIYLVPIAYAFEDGCIYSHSKLGKKIEMMRKNPQVCIQVEEVENFYQWKSVIAWGRFEELIGDEAIIAMRRLIQKVAEKEDATKRSELEIDLSAQLESAIIFRIRIERSTGRYEGF